MSLAFTARKRPIARAVVRRPDDLVWYDAIPNERHAVLVDSAGSGGAFTMIEAVAQPGAATPLHSHRESETFRILEGTVTFAVGADVFEAAAGATVLLPPGTPHAWANRSVAPARMVAVFVPGGIEAMFAALHDRSPADVAALAASYGTEVLGPSPFG